MALKKLKEAVKKATKKEAVTANSENKVDTIPGVRKSEKGKVSPDASAKNWREAVDVKRNVPLGSSVPVKKAK